MSAAATACEEDYEESKRMDLMPTRMMRREAEAWRQRRIVRTWRRMETVYVGRTRRARRRRAGSESAMTRRALLKGEEGLSQKRGESCCKLLGRRPEHLISPPAAARCPRASFRSPNFVRSAARGQVCGKSGVGRAVGRTERAWWLLLHAAAFTTPSPALATQ